MASKTFAIDVRAELMQIAMQEAQIANIGANKASMLFTMDNGLQIINRWNKIAHKPNLSKTQTEQIIQLEHKKQTILAQRQS